MIGWVRLILSVLAVAGLLGAAPGAAVAKAQQHHHHHHCPGMPGGDCPDDDAGALPACCVASVCAVVQPVAPGEGAALAPTGFVLVDLPLRDDSRLVGVPIPPDIRPPIA